MLRKVYAEALENIVQATKATARATTVMAQDMTDGLRKIEQGVRRTGQETDTATGRMTLGFGRLAASLRSVAAAFGLVLGAQAFTGFVRSTISAGIASERFERTLQAATGSLNAARQAMAFIVSTSNQLGQSLEVMVPVFSQLAAATRNTALEGERTQALFSALIGAGQAVGLATDAVGRSMVGLIQIISQNAIQLDEFRNQFASQIPGAMAATARALGMTTEEMLRQISRQKLSVDDLIRGVTQGLREIQRAAPDMSQSAEAAFQRFRNAIFELKASLARSGILDFLSDLADVTRQWVFWIGRVTELRPATGLAALGQLQQQLSDLRRHRVGAESEMAAGRQRGGEQRLAELDQEITKIETQIRLLHERIVIEREVGELAQRAVEEAKQAEADTVKRIDAERKARLQASLEVEARAKAQVGLTSAEFAQMAAGIAQRQALEAQALEQDYRVAIETQVRTVRDREQIERAFAIRRMDQVRQGAREEADVVERTALASRDAKLASIDAQIAAQKMAQESTTATEATERKSSATIQGLLLERTAVQVDAQAAIEAAVAQRTTADADYERELTDIIANEVDKRLALDEQVVSRRLEGQLATLNAQKALIQEQARFQAAVGDPFTAQAESLQQLTAVHEREFAIQADLIRRRTAIALEQAEIEYQDASTRARAITLIREEEIEALNRLSIQQRTDLLRLQNEQVEDWRRFRERVESTLGDFLFRLFEGQIKSIQQLFDSLKSAFFRMLADMLAYALARPITITIATVIGGIVGALSPALGQTILQGLGVGAGATAASLGGLSTQLGGVLSPVFTGIANAFTTVGDVILTGAQGISAAINHAIFGINAPSLTTLSEALSFFGGIAGFGGGLFQAFTAQTAPGIVGGALGAGAGLTAALATIGLLPSILGPIGLALSAILPLLGGLIGGLFGQKGPRLQIGALGGLGVGTTPEGQLAVTGELTSQILRAERVGGEQAIQDALEQGVTTLVTKMVEAINAVALEPGVLLGPTQDALNQALQQALVLNSSSRRNFEEDIAAQLKFIPVQIASFFLDPLAQAFRQLETADLDEQLRRLPQTIVGMVEIFRTMNDQLNELAQVANTDVLGALGEVRARLEAFGAAMVETARIISEEIVVGVTQELQTLVQTFLPLSAGVTAAAVPGLFAQPTAALIGLQQTRGALESVGLDATAINDQVVQLVGDVLLEAQRLVDEAFATEGLPAALAIILQIPEAFTSLAPNWAELQRLAAAFAPVVQANAQAIAAFEAATTPAQVRLNTLAVTITDLQTAIQGAGGAVEVVLPLYAQLSAAIVAQAQLQIQQIQQIDAILQQVQSTLAQQQGPEVQLQAITNQIAPLQALVNTGEATTDELAAIADLYAQQLAALNQLTQAIDATLNSIEATLLANGSIAEQQAALQADVDTILREINSQGMATVDQWGELAGLIQQQLTLQQEITRTLENALQSAQQTILGAVSPAEQISTLQQEIATLEAAVTAGTATPEQLAELVSLNQQLLAVGEQADLLHIQQEALTNLQELTPVLEAQLAASQTLEEMFTAQLEIVQAQLLAWQALYWHMETASITALEAIFDILNAQLLLMAGTTNTQEAIRQIQEQALLELRAIEDQLTNLWTSQQIVQTQLAPPIPVVPVQPIGQAQQGGLLRFAQGGGVPALLEPGELRYPGPLMPTQLQALQAMNAAFPRFGGGLVVPGVGSGDVVPAVLPPGSFVLNRTASRVVSGLQHGSFPTFTPSTGASRGFQQGGPVSGTGGIPEVHHHYDQRITVDLRGSHFSTQDDLERLKRMLVELERRRLWRR